MIQIQVIIILAALLAGFSSGYYLKNIQYKAEKAKLLEQEEKKRLEAQRISNSLFDALLKSQKNVKIVYRNLIKEVPSHAPQSQKTNSDCNLSVDSKRLLNKLIKSVPNS